MTLLIISTLTAGLFAGAAIYINAVEHPARMSCGVEMALSEFAPSYKRATLMQAPLALVGCATGLVGGWLQGDAAAMAAALLLGIVVPFTLIAIAPTNRRLMDPGLRARGDDASALLTRWSRLHAVRSLLAGIAFAVLLSRLAA
jgi:hypothetical protein